MQKKEFSRFFLRAEPRSKMFGRVAACDELWAEGRVGSLVHEENTESAFLGS